MFIRISDKSNNRFYKSIVYGLIHRGFFEQAIVINPYTNCFELVPHLEKENPSVPVYEVIQPDRNGWITYTQEELLPYNLFCQSRSVDYFSGFEDVFEDTGFLSSLLEKNCVCTEKAAVEIRSLEDAQEWNYICTQADANAFMKLFEGFHDSFLNKLTYEETDQTRRLTVVFDNSCWFGLAELCFEGLVAMNLRPAQENYARYMLGGTLIVKDECIFWADDFLKDEDLSCGGSYIKALNLKWRKIG